MNINLSKFNKVPLYEQIISEIKRNIISGQLEEMERLPSIRKLAQDLEVSVITVKKAYETLERENYLMTIPSQGTYVAKLDNKKIKEKMMKEFEDSLDVVVTKAKEIGFDTDELVVLVTKKMEDKA